jgi:hypothetical protein
MLLQNEFIMNTIDEMPASPTTLFPQTPWERQTDAELRKLIMGMTLGSRNDHSQRNCTIRILSGLSYASQNNLVNGMSREVCLEILDEPCSCHKIRTW